jgi:hypothetical protein
VRPETGANRRSAVEPSRVAPKRMEQAPKRGRGRPPRLGERHALLVRLPDELYRALQKAHLETDKSMTELVGVAVKEWIDRRNRK